MKGKLYLLISIIVFISSLFLYVDIGEKLNPYSVNVRGYHRSDGIYVSPYKRRPPGSVQKDRPYEIVRGILVVFLIGSGGFIIVMHI